MESRSRTVTVSSLHGVVVDGDAERRADLVLPAVAPADRAGLVVGDREVLLQDVADRLRLLGMPGLPQQREDGGLDRRERGSRRSTTRSSPSATSSS